MMKMCCVGLRVGYGLSSRFVSTTPAAGLLGPPEIHTDLHKTSVKYVVSPFSPPDPISDRDYIGKACLFLFRFCTLGLVRNRYRMDSALDKSWNEDPLTTLRLIGYMKHNTRTLDHGRRQFYYAALWLHTHHPNTLAGNVRAFSKLGCLKDWPEVLHRLVTGPFVREAEMLERMRARRAKSLRLMAKKSGNLRVSKPDDDSDNDNDNVLGSISKEKKRIQQARQAVKMYKFDPCYRSLHDSVSDLFAELLRRDLELLGSGELQKISWASKWCPSLGSSYDRSTLLCESIARRLFPYDESSYRGIEEAHYAYRVRDRLRKQVLVPLRRALKLPEIYMSNNQWELLPYDRVNLTAMRTYNRLFLKHDQERFWQYIHGDRNKKCKSSHRNGEALLPHEICSSLLEDSGGYDREAVEAQWRRMVETFAEQGKFKNCIVACDWSYRKHVPKHTLNFSLAFQLLASELSDDPWNGKILTETGHKVAEFVKIEGDDLQSKMQCLKALSISSRRLCEFTMLDKILETAVCGKVSREKMVKRLFLMSPFADGGWFGGSRTEEAHEKYEECGYVMPELVYWDLGSWLGSNYVIVPRIGDGITCIEGFSASCFRAFMEKDGKLEKDILLEAEVSGEEYKELKVLD